MNYAWLHGVFCVHMTLKPWSFEVCSAYAPHLWLRAYALRTSSDLNSQVIYTQNTSCNHDLYITYIPHYQYHRTIWFSLLQISITTATLMLPSRLGHFRMGQLNWLVSEHTFAIRVSG